LVSGIGIIGIVPETKAFRDLEEGRIGPVRIAATLMLLGTCLISGCGRSGSDDTAGELSRLVNSLEVCDGERGPLTDAAFVAGDSSYLHFHFEKSDRWPHDVQARICQNLWELESIWASRIVEIEDYQSFSDGQRILVPGAVRSLPGSSTPMEIRPYTWVVKEGYDHIGIKVRRYHEEAYERFDEHVFLEILKIRLRVSKPKHDWVEIEMVRLYPIQPPQPLSPENQEWLDELERRANE
jgi:hypothetical protein